MTRAIRAAPQVIDFAKRLAPEPRRALKKALKELAQERGDFRALEGKLAGFHRLRVGRPRVTFAYAEDGATDAIFTQDRSLVYEIFEAEFIEKLKR